MKHQRETIFSQPRIRRASQARNGLVVTIALLLLSVFVTVAFGQRASAVTITGGLGINEIATMGPSHSLDLCGQPYGSSAPWTCEQIAGPKSAYSTPFATRASATSLLVVAVLGPKNSLDFYWVDNSGTFHKEIVAGPNTTYSAPEVSSGNGAYQIAAEGAGHSLDFYWQKFDTVPWNEQNVASTGTTYSQPALVNAECAQAFCGNNGVTDIYVEGPNRELLWYEEVWGGGWGGWGPGPVFKIEPANSVYSAPAAQEIGDGVNSDNHVAWVGPNGTLMYWWYGTEGNSGTETVAGSGSSVDMPAIAFGNNSVAISANSPDGALDFYWQTNDAANWNFQPVNSSGSVHSPSIAEGNNATAIAVQGPNNSLEFYWQGYGGSTGWNPEEVEKPNTTFG